jgi:dolichol-phosphate mannosyltransferase
MPTSQPLVIVPTLNERENVTLLLPRVAAALPQAALLVVDDASPDGTADAVRTLAERLPVSVLARDGERGLGRAYQAGLRHGLAHGFDPLFTMDADLSHDPSYLPAMLAALERSDVVVGSRYAPDGGVINWELRRVMLSWTANRFARFVLGLPGRDLTSGFRGYRRALLERVDLDRIRSNGYSYLVEMLFLARRAGASIAEVPIIFHDRSFGHSKISKREIYLGALTLLRLRVARR